MDATYTTRVSQHVTSVCAHKLGQVAGLAVGTFAIFGTSHTNVASCNFSTIGPVGNRATFLPSVPWVTRQQLADSVRGAHRKSWRAVGVFHTLHALLLLTGAGGEEVGWTVFVGQAGTNALNTARELRVLAVVEVLAIHTLPSIAVRLFGGAVAVVLAARFACVGLGVALGCWGGAVVVFFALYTGDGVVSVLEASRLRLVLQATLTSRTGLIGFVARRFGGVSAVPIFQTSHTSIIGGVAILVGVRDTRLVPCTFGTRNRAGRQLHTVRLLGLPTGTLAD